MNLIGKASLLFGGVISYNCFFINSFIVFPNNNLNSELRCWQWSEDVQFLVFCQHSSPERRFY